MAKRRSEKNKSVGLFLTNETRKKGLEFVNRLVSDDNFRTELENNPRKVFAEYQIYFPAGGLPKKLKLPSKESLLKAISKSTKGEMRSAVPLISAYYAIFAFFAFVLGKRPYFGPACRVEKPYFGHLCKIRT